jgi:hypothetical protein
LPKSAKGSVDASTELAGAQRSAAEKWTVYLSPYIWGASIDGTIRPFTGAPTARVKKSFSDVLEDVNRALYINAYAVQGKTIISADLNYSDSSRNGKVPPGVKARAGLRQTSLTLLGGYRVADKPSGTVDLLAGIRTWKVKGSVDVPAGGVSRSSDKGFTDFLLGIRTTAKLSEDWSFLAYGDFGIFKGGSKSTSSYLLAFNYQAKKDFFVSLGYREVALDYRKGGSRFDVATSGPVLGVTWKL